MLVVMPGREVAADRVHHAGCELASLLEDSVRQQQQQLLELQESLQQRQQQLVSDANMHLA